MSAVDERIQTFSGETKVENEVLNRFQDDAILNSDQLEGLTKDLHYPHVTTSDNKLAFTTGADKVTITGGQVLSVGGIRFDTSDLDNLELTIPDGFDGYIRVAVAADCGDVVDAGADPIVRKMAVTFSQTTGAESDAEGTGGGPSSPESARLFHVTKGAGGSTPTVTAYANTGHSHISTNPAAEDVSYDNTASGVAADNVQAALDEIQNNSPFTNYVLLTSSGTFTQGVDCPALITNFWVEVWGGGAGGASVTYGGSGPYPNGGAGGAGEYRAGAITLDPDEAVTVTVAASVAADTDGNSSSFGTYITANGGSKGTSTQYAIGLGGTGGSGGDINHDGQAGEGAADSAYDTSTGGSAFHGGQGGAGGSNSTVDDVQDGHAPGGGGAGACGTTGTTAGGQGARGAVIIRW